MIYAKSGCNWTRTKNRYPSSIVSQGHLDLREKPGVDGSLEPSFISSFLQPWAAKHWPNTIQYTQETGRFYEKQSVSSEVFSCSRHSLRGRSPFTVNTSTFVTDSVPQRMLLTDRQNKLLNRNVNCSKMVGCQK